MWSWTRVYLYIIFFFSQNTLILLFTFLRCCLAHSCTVRAQGLHRRASGADQNWFCEINVHHLVGGDSAKFCGSKNVPRFEGLRWWYQDCIFQISEYENDIRQHVQRGRTLYKLKAFFISVGSVYCGLMRWKQRKWRNDLLRSLYAVVPCRVKEALRLE
jgi:hypothetical protein